MSAYSNSDDDVGCSQTEEVMARDFQIVELAEPKPEGPLDVLRIQALVDFAQDCKSCNFQNDQSFSELSERAFRLIDLTSAREVFGGIVLLNLKNVMLWATGKDLPKPSGQRLALRWFCQEAENELEELGS